MEEDEVSSSDRWFVTLKDLNLDLLMWCCKNVENIKLTESLLLQIFVDRVR